MQFGLMYGVNKMKVQTLNEVFKIVEIQDGAIKSTKNIGLYWIDQENGLTPRHVQDKIICPLGAKHNYRWERRQVSDDTPNMSPYLD